MEFSWHIKIQDCDGVMPHRRQNYKQALRHPSFFPSWSHFLVRLLVFSFLVVCVLGGLLSWLQELADVVVLNCNGGEKMRK